ncbi:hypothetical protein [Aneurinibacillus tyrosinisolvens]|uniref:hypothetical protein n=1 Tax=Aneurinibacillus tyrosinisolvens TaxID=1443435 RepID=UPI00063EF52C|nr:hypothetical protein [Aneurinibacillus tyrosinisolvens]
MNWFSWLSLGYWLGGGQNNNNSNFNLGCLSIIIFVLAAEYILPEWLGYFISPGRLIGFEPLRIIVTLIIGGLYLFLSRKAKKVPLKYILFFIGVSNLFYALIMPFDSRF